MFLVRLPQMIFLHTLLLFYSTFLMPTKSLNTQMLKIPLLQIILAYDFYVTNFFCNLSQTPNLYPKYKRQNP